MDNQPDEHRGTDGRLSFEKARRTAEPAAAAWAMGDLVHKAAILDIDKHLAYNQGAHLYALNLRQRDDGWQAVVKVVQDGRYRVAFLTCRNFGDCLDTLAEFCQKGLLDFKADRFPPKR